MKKMYKKPETESISVKMNTTLCASEPQTPQTVGFGSGDAIGGGENL